MVPVLPQKTVFAKLAFEKDHIVLSRKRELIRFIRKCLEHPILRKSPELHDFIGNKLDEDAEVIDDFPHDDGWGIEKIYNLVSKSFYGSKPRHTTEKDHQIMNFQAKIHETLTIVQSLKDRLQSLQNDNDKKLELTSKFLNDVQSSKDCYLDLSA
jgi:PX domain.